MVITFYTNSSSGPFIQKILFMFHETEVSYSPVNVDMNNDVEVINKLLRINPNKKVPVIRDDKTGAVVYESNAILFYLAEKTNLFLPNTNVERIEVMKWLMFEAANFAAVMDELYYYLVKSSTELSESHFKRYKNKISSFCTMLDDQLSSREYLCNKFSIADITYYPWFVVLEDLTDIDLNNYTNLKKWFDIISDRPSQKKIREAQ